MPNGLDSRDHMRRQDPYLYTPTQSFPQSFWQHYATRHTCTPRVRQFLNGWGSYKAWYGVQDLNIWIKQLLRKGGNVVVYVTGEKTEPKEPSFARTHSLPRPNRTVRHTFRPLLCAPNRRVRSLPATAHHDPRPQNMGQSDRFYGRYLEAISDNIRQTIHILNPKPSPATSQTVRLNPSQPVTWHHVP